MGSVLSQRPKRGPTRAFVRLTMMTGMVALAGCTLPGARDVPGPMSQPTPISDAAPVAERPAPVTRERSVRRGTVQQTSFLGQPVGSLEALFGDPALVRREGNNEFRRYDAGACRLLAVVTPAGGTVSTLEVGPAKAGEAAPSFDACVAAATAAAGV